MRKRTCMKRERSRGRFVLTADTRMVNLFSYVQDTHVWQQWRSHEVSLRTAQRMVLEGEATAVHRMVNGEVILVGYQATRPMEMERPSPSTLTENTIKAVANAVGKSSDIRLTRYERSQVEKYRVWPLVGDTKAPAVRPRLNGRERELAQSVLERGYVKAA